APDGTLSRPGVSFELGESEFDSKVSFTPDGRLGVTVIIDQASNEGRVAVFRIDDGGAVTVTEPAFAIPDFDPRHVTVDPTGSFVWALDSNRFGAVTVLALSCEGRLALHGPALPATLPRSVAFVPGTADRALLASRAGPAFGGVPLSPASFTLFDAAGGNAQPLAFLEAFGAGDPDGSFTGFALTADGRYGLAVEDNLFPSTPDHNNRVAVASVGPASLARAQTLVYEPPPGGKRLEAAFDLITSPFNNAALISAGLGSTDAIWQLSYDPADTAAPFAFVGEIDYSSGPQLPGSMVVIRRGPLAGSAFVVEVPGIRQLRFSPDGDVIDLGVYPLDSIGALGVQP
ncbi:MAG TPA: hypothetical protein VFS00_03475, partial [Polyangiaceae bacterium]|nr:hypothetical protein [Polyangiaceae bacterium]